MPFTWMSYGASNVSYMRPLFLANASLLEPYQLLFSAPPTRIAWLSTKAFPH